MIQETCKSCRFWLADEKGLTDNSPEVEGEQAVPEYPAFGQCRRNPPVISDHMAGIAIGHPSFGHVYDPETLATSYTVNQACMHPVTFHTAWCGEHAAGIAGGTL